MNVIFNVAESLIALAICLVIGGLIYAGVHSERLDHERKIKAIDACSKYIAPSDSTNFTDCVKVMTR